MQLEMEIDPGVVKPPWWSDERADWRTWDLGDNLH